MTPAAQISPTSQITDENRTAFSSWHEIIIKNQNTEEEQEAQQELMDAVAQGSVAFAFFLREKLELVDKVLAGIPDLHRELTSSEASNPPVQLEQELWAIWQDMILPHEAAQPIYWNIAYLYWIEQGWLGDDLLSTLIPREAKDLDAQTRTVLRNIGGLPRARGNVSVFSDCPMARAWWRCKIAESATYEKIGNPNLDFIDAHIAIHRKSIWEPLVLNSLRRVAVVNDPKLRSSIIQYLASPDTKATTSKTCSQLIQNLAQLVQNFSPSLLDWDDLYSLVEKAADGIDAEAKTDPDDELEDEVDEELDDQPADKGPSETEENPDETEDIFDS